MDMKRNQKISSLALMVLATAALGACSADDTTEAPEPAVTVAGPSEVVPTESEASASESETTPSATPTSESAAPVESVTPSSDAQLLAGTVEDAAIARDLALAHVADAGGAGGVVIGQDLEDRDNRWDVDVLAGDQLYEVKVRTTGESTATDEQESADDDDRDAAAASVTVEQAIDAALAHTAGIIEEIKWEDDDRAGWKVDVVPTGQDDEVELRVDPSTAAVTVEG